LPNSDAPRQHPAIAAILVQDAVLALETVGATMKVVGEPPQQASQIFAVDAFEPFVGAVADLLLTAPHHDLPAGREVDLVLLEIPVPEAFVTGARRNRVPFVALSHDLRSWARTS
jgi:hypothetical protein